MWETSEEADCRGQANARLVAQVQYQHILESGHSHREIYSRVHKGNRKEGKVREEVGTIARNQYLACEGRSGHERGYPSSVDRFVQGKK